MVYRSSPAKLIFNNYLLCMAAFMLQWQFSSCDNDGMALKLKICNIWLFTEKNLLTSDNKQKKKSTFIDIIKFILQFLYLSYKI